MVEIEIDGPNNDHLLFRPLLKTLRGRFDLMRCKEPLAMQLRTRYPVPIPGLHVVLDPDKKTAAIVDPLYAKENAAIRERIDARGMKLPPEREEFTDVDSTTWAFWLRSAVKAGVAKVVSGTWPEIDPQKAQKNFIIAPRPRDPDPRDSLIEKLVAQNDKLVAVMLASLPADRRKEVAGLVGG